MRRAILVLVVAACLAANSGVAAGSPPDDIAERARALHFASLLVDTHDDTTQRMLGPSFDFGARHDDGHVDIPRMREGGLDALFLSIWIDGRTKGPAAVQKALDQVDAIREAVRTHAKDLALATTADEVRRAQADGKIAVLMGVEGGHMIGNDIRMVRVLGAIGVRYLTLSHFYNDEWADSSTDKPVHNGLTAYDRTAGGVVATVDAAVKRCGDDAECAMREMLAIERRLTESGALPPVTWERIVEHIDHVVKLVGPDHAGLGSDFDGASTPDGMEDCSRLPKITEALLRRGYKEDDIRKILGGNTLRVLAEAERVRREMQ